MSSEEVDYYNNQSIDPRGIRYRLDATEVIEETIDRLRGGYTVVSGVKRYKEQQRMMNEEGIACVDFFLRGAVNKISHLTNFANEARVMIQIRELASAFLQELTLCRKVWAPDAWIQLIKKEKEFKLPDGSSMTKEVYERVPLNPTRDRVKNPRLVLQVVENAMLASYQRGIAGFEALNLVKSWQVTENIGKQPGEQEEEGRVKRWFNMGGKQ